MSKEREAMRYKLRVRWGQRFQHTHGKLLSETEVQESVGLCCAMKSYKPSKLFFSNKRKIYLSEKCLRNVLFLLAQV